MNNVDQITPYGTIKYNQTGTVDVDGHKVPTWQATTTLAPEQQKQLDLEHQTGTKMSEIALAQTGRMGDLLSKPVDLSNNATEARLMELGSRRLEPRFEQDRAALEQRLRNQGLQPGSQAWNAQMQNFGQNVNDARTQLVLTGHQQAIAEALQERNQPINETVALMNGQQVQNPMAAGGAQVGIAAPDLAGMIYKNYDAKNAQYQGMMGGMFGLGSAAFGTAGRIFGGGTKPWFLG